nr:hypothetical protein [Azotobacter vinelandii]
MRRLFSDIAPPPAREPVASREIEVDTTMPRPTEHSPRSNGRKGFPAGNVFQEPPEGAIDPVAAETERQGESKDPLESYTRSAADELEKIAEGARAAACELEEQDEQGLSDYVLNAADRMFRFADQLRGRSAEQLFHDADRLARDNPGLFLAGSIALGFGLTRFARASGRRSRHAEAGPLQSAPVRSAEREEAVTGPAGVSGSPDVAGTRVTTTPDDTTGRSVASGLSPVDPGRSGPGTTGTIQGGTTGPACQNDKGPNGGTKR